MIFHYIFEMFTEELKVTFNRLQEEYFIEKSEKEKELEEVERNHKIEVDEMHDKYKEEMDKCELFSYNFFVLMHSTKVNYVL